MTHARTGGGAPARTSDRVRAKPSSSWHDDWSDAHAQIDSMKSQASSVFIPASRLSPANSWIASLCSSLHDSSLSTRSEASIAAEWLSTLSSRQQDATGLAWEATLQRDRDEDGTLHRGRRGSSRAHHQHHHPYQLPADAGISLGAMPACGPFQASAGSSVDTTPAIWLIKDQAVQNTAIEFGGVPASSIHDVQAAAPRASARLNVDTRRPHGETRDPNDDAGLTLGPGEPWRVQLPRAAPWAVLELGRRRDPGRRADRG